jgi:nicotinamidase-related amidase
MMDASIVDPSINSATDVQTQPQETIMSTALALDPKTTAFLFMDFQNGVMPRVGDRADEILRHAKSILDAARAAGACVVFVRVAFRAGYPELSDRNPMAAMVKTSGMLQLDSPEAQIIDALAPRPAEPVVVKHRVGPFAGTDLAPILRAHGADTLVLLGVSTSGVVLSTVRHAADEDYRVVVVEDACADPDAEVHRVLMEKVLSRQATVTRSEAVVAALAQRA